MIKRKPVPKCSPTTAIEQHPVQECIKRSAVSSTVYELDPPLYDSDEDDSLLDCYLSSDKEEPHKRVETAGLPVALDVKAVSVSSEAPADAEASRSAKVKNALETAYSDAKHFAGGLISHPHESTRHYSVLRQSLGLVYYRGPMTNVVITILSDRPLPDDRTIWLQRRGFSGSTGLAIGAAFGARNAWIDVTPVTQRTPDQLLKDQERAWQRDISTFSKKVRDLKHLCDHNPRETMVIRIPHAAEDGYFRILVCSSRKVLCPSPTFRYASTSMDPGSLRGASLLTLSLELGLKVGARMANTAINAATHHALRPATAVVQAASKNTDLGPTHWIGVRGASSSLESDGGFFVRR